MLHRVETKISGSFSWILLGRFCCGLPFVFPCLVPCVWSSLLGSFAVCSVRVVCSDLPCLVFLAWSFAWSFAWSSFVSFMCSRSRNKQEKNFHSVTICVRYRYTLQAQGNGKAQGIAEGCARWNSVGASGRETMAGGTFGEGRARWTWGVTTEETT